MDDDSLIQALPELVAFIRRDGTFLRELGGRRLGLPADGQLVGKNITEVWPADVAALLLKMIRRALRGRSSADAHFADAGRQYEVRIAAHGPERVLCLIRAAMPAASDGEPEGVRGGDRNALERRALFAQLGQLIDDARLRERPLAVCMIYLQGIEELGRLLHFEVSEQMAAILLQRLSAALAERPTSCSGRLAENVLLGVIEGCQDRNSLRSVAAQLLQVLGQPVAVGDATFSALPSAGLAVLGEDATDARQLLENARSAMLEARRQGANSAYFYSDTLPLRSLARMDVGNELRLAITQDRLTLRYSARHCLQSGRLIAVQAYFRWLHPIRGEVPPSEFLQVAESSGLSISLSAWGLTRLQRDLPALRALAPAGLKFCFGPLLPHLASAAFQSQVAALLGSGALTAADFELRISERSLGRLADPAAVLGPLADLGVALIIDEFGQRSMALPRLARLPLRALQLDRRLARAASADPVARRAAAAALAVAKAPDLVPMAAGIDDQPQHQLLEALGCIEGLGEVFPGIIVGATGPAPAASATTR